MKGRIAAKPDARSGYISQTDPSCVFTSVNRNEPMNTYATIIAGKAGPIISGTAARAYAGTLRHATDPISSGIRGAGQYCCRPARSSTAPTMTALRMTRGTMAVPGMCP
jgi:hypothetical protein